MGVDPEAFKALQQRMAAKKRKGSVPLPVIAEAYSRLGNVWEVAKEVGLCGQSVHERLAKAALITPVNAFTEEHDKELTEKYSLYVDTGRLDELAKEFGRTKQFLCRQANRLGLTSKSRIGKFGDREAMSAARKKWHQENDHPKGMLGKKHSADTLEVISKSSKDRWANMTEGERSDAVTKQLKGKLTKYGKLNTSEGPRKWKAAWHEIGGTRKFYRSKWESNYAYYLEWQKGQGLISTWEHEPETFWFEGVKRGTRSYLPDFRVTDNNGGVAYHEVKGWMDAASKTKLKRMKKYHPHIKMELIDSKRYSALARKVKSIVPGWQE